MSMIHGINISIPYFSHELLDGLLPLVARSYANEDYHWCPPGGIGQHFIHQDDELAIVKPFINDLLIKPKADLGMLSITGPNTWLHKHSDIQSGFDWVKCKLTIPLTPREDFQPLPYYDENDKVTLWPMSWHQPCLIDTITVHGGFTTNQHLRAHLQFTFNREINEVISMIENGQFLRSFECTLMPG